MGEASKTKVMIVDQSLFIRKMIKTIFNCNDSYEVIGECNSGEEGVYLARKLQPQIIVLGGELNDLSCEDFRDKLNLYENNFRVIVISGSEKCKSCMLGFESGRCELIQKPFNPQVLMDMLETSTNKDLVKVSN
jgi:DNA-binding response OmpR family regulator